MSHATRVASALRCTAFEEFMLDQDSPTHPCVICLRLELAGDLDAARLQQALSRVVQQHPLLRSKLQCRYGKLWWIVAPDSDVKIEIHITPTSTWPVQRYFDLSQNFGYHIELFPSAAALESDSVTPPTWTLFLQVHHGIADGLGCWQIVEDLLAEYSSGGPGSTALVEVDLRQRNRFGLSLIDRLRLVPQQLVGLAGVRQFLSRCPVPMSPRVVSDTPSPNITAVHYRCTVAQSQQLKEDAKQRQATLNDLLACLVFEACDQYRQMQMSYRGQEWLRMMVPMSLREPQSEPQSTDPTIRLSACNVVSCIFLDRTGQQISDRNELLKSIHDEMELIKKNRLSLIFIFSLWLRKNFRWRSRARALIAPTPRRCQTSIVFSNMGRLFASSALPTNAAGEIVTPGITLQSCEVLAPIAPLMRVAITAFQYAGQLTLALRYDSAVFTEADAKRLLALLVQRIDCQTPEMIEA